MSPDDQDLIFSHSLGLSDGPDLLRAEALIADNSQAAQLCAVLRQAVVPLSLMTPEYCPDELAERTLLRLRALADSERRVPSPAPIISLGWGWRLSNAAGTVVVAACILLIVGVLVPSSQMMRHRSYAQLCRAGLARIFPTLQQYSSDHDGFLPMADRDAGASWHAIGDPGPGQGSNTRNPYLLLSLRYMDRPENFLCCGKTRSGAPPLTAADVARYRDFPSRDHITYSYRLMPSGGLRLVTLGRRPLMADMNPHFESLETVASRGLTGVLDEEALGLNSVNHGRRGQNVLAADGHASYSRTRYAGDPDDDIYTMEGGTIGDGCQLPSCLDDAMLGP